MRSSKRGHLSWWFARRRRLRHRATHLDAALVVHAALRVAQLHHVAAGPGQPLGARAAADGAVVNPPAQLRGGRAAGVGQQGQALARGRDVGVEREDGAVLRRADARGVVLRRGFDVF